MPRNHREDSETDSEDMEYEHDDGGALVSLLFLIIIVILVYLIWKNCSAQGKAITEAAKDAAKLIKYYNH
jgi:hypothetical protein